MGAGMGVGPYGVDITVFLMKGTFFTSPLQSCLLLFSDDPDAFDHAHDHQRHEDHGRVLVEGKGLADDAGDEEAEHEQHKQAVVGDSRAVIELSFCQKLQILGENLAVGVQRAGHEQDAGDDEDHAGDEGGDVFRKVEAHDHILVHPRHRHPHKGQHRRQDHGPGDVLAHGAAFGDVGKPPRHRGCPGQKPEDPACRRGAVEVFLPEGPGDGAGDGAELKIGERGGQHREKREEEHQERKAGHALEQIVAGRDHGHHHRDGGEHEFHAGEVETDEAGHGVHAGPERDGHAQDRGEHGGELADFGIHVPHVPQAHHGVHGPDRRAVEKRHHRNGLRRVEALLHVAYEITRRVHERDARTRDEHARDPHAEGPRGLIGVVVKLDASAVFVPAFAGDKQRKAQDNAQHRRHRADHVNDLIEYVHMTIFFLQTPGLAH